MFCYKIVRIYCWFTTISQQILMFYYEIVKIYCWFTTMSYNLFGIRRNNRIKLWSWNIYKSENIDFIGNKCWLELKLVLGTLDGRSWLQIIQIHGHYVIFWKKKKNIITIFYFRFKSKILQKKVTVRPGLEIVCGWC